MHCVGNCKETRPLKIKIKEVALYHFSIQNTELGILWVTWAAEMYQALQGIVKGF